MTNKIFLIAVLLLSASLLSAQPLQLWQLRDLGIVRWEYVDGDEFDDEKIDSQKWRKSFPWGRNLGNNMLQYYADDNTFVEDGILKMEARKERVFAKGISYEPADKIMSTGERNERQFEYTSGMLFSEQQYFQGLFESSIKNPRGQGFFPGFWLFGGNPNEEIDIIEAKGERPNSYHIDMHCADGCAKYKRFLFFNTGSYGDWVDSESDLTADFHLYTCEWIPGEIYFSLDDQVKGQWAGNLDHKANIIYNFGISNHTDKGDFSGPIDSSTPFPATFEADYLRIYKPIDTQLITLGQPGEDQERKKARRKSKRKQSQRVSGVARIYVTEKGVKLETTSDPGVRMAFRVSTAEGSPLGVLARQESGDLELDMTSATPGKYVLIGDMGTFQQRLEFDWPLSK